MRELTRHLLQFTARDVDQPSDETQWACSFLVELQNLGAKTKLTQAEKVRVAEITNISKVHFGFGNDQGTKKS